MEALVQFLKEISKVPLKEASDTFFLGILESVESLIPSRVSSFWLHNLDEGKLSLAGLRIPPHKKIDFSHIKSLLTIDDSATGKLLLAGQNHLLIPDVSQEAKYVNKSLASEFGLRQLLLLAVTDAPTEENLRPDQIMGVLNLYPEGPLPANLPTLVDVIGLQTFLRIHSYQLFRKVQAATELVDLIEIEKGLYNYLDSVTRLAARMVDAAGCSIFLLNEQDQVYDLAATTARITDSQKRSTRYFPGQGLTGTVGHTGKPFISRDLHRETAAGIFLEVERSRGKSFIAVPIFDSKHRSIGVLRCVNKQPKSLVGLASAFSAEDAGILDIIASILGLLYEASQVDIRTETILQDISHEVRSPLSGIMGRAAVLIRKVKDKTLEGEKFEQKLLTDVLDITELITILIEGISTLREDISDYRFSPTLLFGDVVIKWCKLLAPLGIHRKIKIHYEGEKLIPKLYLDRRKFEQVIFNLLSNAIKYSHDETDTIVEGAVGGEYYLLKVRNYGIAIPERIVELIFLKGFRTDAAKDKFPIGKGLGLAIVKTIVEMHGGRVIVTGYNLPTELTIFLPKSLERRPPR